MLQTRSLAFAPETPEKGPVKELRNYVRQAHIQCLHKFKPPERRVVEIDFSRISGDPAKKTYLTYIEHFCPKCELTIRYPIVDFCSVCGARMKKAGARPHGWRRESRDPFEGVAPEAYVCGNDSCKTTVIVVDALYEPPEEDE